MVAKFFIARGAHKKNFQTKRVIHLTKNQFHADNITSVEEAILSLDRVRNGNGVETLVGLTYDAGSCRYGHFLCAALCLSG